MQVYLAEVGIGHAHIMIGRAVVRSLVMPGENPDLRLVPLPPLLSPHGIMGHQARI